MATPNTPAFITQIVDQDIDYTGDIYDRDITVDPTPQLSGSAPVNSHVYIYDDGKLIGSVQADGEGNWSFTPDRDLGTGSHVLTVMANGKMSEPVVITVQASGASTGRPVITSVVDNEGEPGEVEHGATISDKPPTLSGTAAPNAYVEIFSSGRSVGFTQANAEGHWTITPTLPEGLNILSVKSQGQHSDIFTLTVEAATSVKPIIESVHDNHGESAMVGDGGSTDDNTPTVSGTARPGAIIQLYANGREVGRAQADSNGNWSITSSALDNGEQVLKVSSDGKFSDGFTINVEASTTPELPELSIQTVYDDQGESGMVGDGGSTDDNTPTVSGTARPGAIVQLYANGREVGRAQADSNGNWSITTSALDSGEQVLKVSSEGKFSDGFTINVEASTTPQLSIQTVYDDQGESGMVGDGGSTDDNTPTVSGTARPGAIVQLYANGREVGRAQADSNGNWSITTSALDSGEQVLKVSSEGKFSDGFTINVEASTTPQLSIQTVYDDQGESGMVGDGGSTDDNTPTVSGTARPGAIVQLYANGREVGRAQADSNGNWSITTSALDSGEQVLKVSSEGKFSDGFTINVEASTTPQLSIQTVYDDQGESGMVGEGGSTDDNTPTVSGTARPGAIVQLYANGREVGRAQADSNGNWSITTSALDSGEQVLKVSSEGKFSDGFTINVEAPTTPQLSIQTVYDNQGESGMVGEGGSTDDNTPTVSGTARPGAIVQLYANGREVGRAQADSNGNWSITTSALDSGEQVLKVSSEGKFSDGFTINVEAPTTPELPELSIQSVYDDQGESGMVGEGGSTDDNTPTVSGTARPGAIVQLYANGREVGRAQADSNGNWSITTSALDNGQQVLKVSSEGTFSDGYVIDVQVPAEGGEPVRPAIEYVYDDFGSDVGQRYSGDSIDDRTPLLAGTAAPHAIVEIYSNGQLIYTLQAGETGHWGFTASLPYGEHTLTAVVGGVSSEPFDLTIVDPSQVPVESEHNNALSLDSLLADSHLDVFGETTEPVAELDPAQTLQLMEAFMSESANALGGNVADLGCMPLTAELVLPVEELLQPTL